MGTTFSSFSNYRQTVLDLRDDLLKLKEYSALLKLTGTESSIKDTLQKSAEDSFDVAIIGEFRRGKSTLINALLGKPILPSDVLPTTATLNRVTYGVTPFVEIEYKDGSKENIEIDKLSEYVTKLTGASAKKAATIKQATVYYPINYCKNNVDIIDTPGLNDDANMTEVTLSVIPQVDASIFVIMAQSPFSEFERDFLENKMLVSDIGRIIFVVTRIDAYDDETADRIVDYIRGRIQEYVIERAKKVLGEDSKEFKEYEQKLGSIKVIGISPLQALKAKTTEDDDLLTKSRYPAFEKELEHLLTEERGAISLQVQVSKILSSTTELLKTIELRTNALQMDEDEFNEKYDNAKKIISDIRKKRKDEFDKMNKNADLAYAQIKPQANGYWKELIKNAEDVIDNEAISKNDISKDNIDAAQKRILNKVQESTRNLAQLLSERMQNSIDSLVGQELGRLNSFENEFFSSLSDIQNSFQPGSAATDDKTSALVGAGGAVAFATLIGGVWGGAAGGIYDGYKQAGAKGALVGGAASLAGSFATAISALTVLSLVGVAASGIILLPVFAISGIVGAFTGKFALNKIFHNDMAEEQIAKFRASLKTAVEDKFKTLASESDMTETVRKQINDIFASLRDKIDKETEGILKDTEATLGDLQKQVAQKQVMAEQEKNDLKTMIENIAVIAGKSAELNKQLLNVLGK